jgi:uncharacterized protein
VRFFSWDPKKSDWTLQHRGFSFATAAQIFDDPNCLIEPAKSKNGEARAKAIGALPDSDILIVLTVIYTERQEDGKETIRIISACPADKHESRRYSRLS